MPRLSTPPASWHVWKSLVQTVLALELAVEGLDVRVEMRIPQLSLTKSKILIASSDVEGDGFDMKKDDLSKRYDYRVDVQEGRAGISYFTDSIDLSKATFVTFAPRYRLAGRGGLDEEVKGQILTFPSHLIKKITNHIHT